MTKLIIEDKFRISDLPVGTEYSVGGNSFMVVSVKDYEVAKGGVTCLALGSTSMRGTVVVVEGSTEVDVAPVKVRIKDLFKGEAFLMGDSAYIKTGPEKAMDLHTGHEITVHYAAEVQHVETLKIVKAVK